MKIFTKGRNDSILTILTVYKFYKLNYKTTCVCYYTYFIHVVGLVKCIGSGVYKLKKTHTTLVSSRWADSLKFICYIITIDISVTTFNLKILNKWNVLPLKYGELVVKG